MTRLFRIGIILFFSTLLFSCSQKKERIPESIPPLAPVITPNTISIRLIDQVEFRRSFAGIQFIEGEKEQEKYEREVERSNPVSDDKNEEFRKMLARFGFVKGKELLLNKFKYQTKEENKVTDSSGNLVKIKFIHDLGTATISDSWSIALFTLKDSASIKVNMHPWELKYALLDIIPGGYKEIVVLEEWYIANGYNFDFYGYEIKTR